MPADVPTWTYVISVASDEARAQLDESFAKLAIRPHDESSATPPTFRVSGCEFLGTESTARHLVALGDGGSASVDKAAAAGADDYWTLPLAEAALLELRLRGVLKNLRRADHMVEQEAKFESLISNIPGIVYRCEFDRGWTMKYISESVNSITGFAPHEFTDGTRDYGSIMLDEDRDRVDAEVAAALDSDTAFYLEYRIRRADGVVRWVGSRGRGVRAQGGNLKFLDGAIFDISAEKQVQAELEENREELARSIKDLKRIDALRTRMFQNVSHELRTPLALILAPAQRLMAKAPEATKSTLASIMHNGYRLLDQINALLDVARMDATGLPIRPVSMDVAAFLERLVADVRPAASDRNQELTLKAEGELRFYLDPQHVERVVLNLLSNALKFTPPGGRVDIIAAKVDGELRIQVRDTGPGIPKAAQVKIFQRFVQADDEADTTVGGTGIGLALVLELTRRMGGEVHLQSELGYGAEFTLTFPAELQRDTADDSAPQASNHGLAGISRRARYEALRDEEMRSARDEGTQLVRGTDGPRVLVVEDNRALNREISEVLAAQFQVTSVFDGLEALDAIGDVRPAAIVSDVAMPRLDGIELTRRLRERPDFRDVGIILLSAHADVEDRIRGRQVGVDAYLTKPFHPDELAATVEGILRSRLRLVGSYQVHEALGSGGQGSVFLGESRSGRFVALKLMSGGSLVDGHNQAVLQREIDTLRQLDHPNVVRIVEDGADRNVAFVAMEYLDGINLREMLASGVVFDDAQGATTVLGICRGVQAIHAAGLLHRDLKCGNVMIVRSGPRDSSAIRIVDFGLASESSSGSESHASGTAPYMAPELKQTGESSVATDIFALGVLAYRLLTNEHPSQPPTFDDDTLHRGWVEGALEKDPALRPSLEEIIAEVEGFNLEAALPPLPVSSSAAQDLADTE